MESAYSVFQWMSQKMANDASLVFIAIALLLAVRIAMDGIKYPALRRPLLMISLAIALTSVLFDHLILSFWLVVLLIGWSLTAYALTKPYLKKKNILKNKNNPLSMEISTHSLGDKDKDKEKHSIQDVLDYNWGHAGQNKLHSSSNGNIYVSFSFLLCGLSGLMSGWTPTLSLGPSMWPTSPKSISVDFVHWRAFDERAPTYGDDIHFEVSGPSPHPDRRLLEAAGLTGDGNSWDVGRRFRKRIWGLPGDEVRITEFEIQINGEVFADCRSRERSLAQGVWLCEGRFPNGETVDIVWGEQNLSWYATGQWHLEEDEYFAIGDNTIESGDSRENGPIRGSWIIGEYLAQQQDELIWQAWQ